MGILRSFNVSVTGLQSMGAGMGVIADNIANANTLGFKSSRPEFQDVLATSLKGIDGGDQFGAGTKLAHIKPIMTQGDVARTDAVTDLAINGDGLFQVNAPFGKGYTRDGSLHFNKEGELVNSDEYQVVGYQANEQGKVTNKLGPIKLGGTTIPAKATSEVAVNMNLDSRAEVQEFNIEDPENTSAFSHSMTVYDNVGTARLVTLYYNKTGNNTWDYHAVVDGKDAEGGEEGTFVEMANGTLVFNEQGKLQEEQPGASAFNFNKGAAPGQQIKFDWGESITDGGEGLDATTQYGSRATVARHTQDGASRRDIGFDVFL